MSQKTPDKRPYSLSFSASSLRPELGRIIAEIYLNCGDWEQTRQQVVKSNALQARSESSAIRMERELRQRLQTLTRQQLEILAQAPADGRGAISWLAACKYSLFIFEFAADVLRGKFDAQDPVLRPSDYENHIASQSAAHPELVALSPATQVKLRNVLKTMLREVGILGPNSKNQAITRPLVSPEVQEAILADDRRWLAAFLVPDGEIAALRK